MADKKSTLFVMQHAPIGSRSARDGVEALMAFAAFEQPVSILFVGQGAFQLLQNQASEAVGLKPHSKLLAALALYDIDNIYICAQTLKELGLSNQPLCISAQPLAASEINDLIAEHQSVLCF
ncbi:sulfurtransferase complex subunit TusC [Halioxenophilus aromaticivorans]|uniref:Sulfurtransferase complex subunit TusC n=1 Tax=Halioxenophilus aromaticivorans TaxID=1306992 RepID=A0AAV3UAG7_9ALTE